MIAEEVTPLLSAHSDNINLNRRLFERIKSVYDNQKKENLTTEQKLVLDKYYKGFVRGGANLAADEQEKLKKINGELSMLALKYGNNLLKETNNYQLVVEKEKDLSGLPASVVSTAAEAAREAGMAGKWLFTLHNPSIMPFLQYADNRELREEIYKAYINRETATMNTITSPLSVKLSRYGLKKPVCSDSRIMPAMCWMKIWPGNRKMCTNYAIKSGKQPFQ